MSVSTRVVYRTDRPQSFLVVDAAVDSGIARKNLGIVSGRFLTVLKSKPLDERYRLSEELRIVFDWVSANQTSKAISSNDILTVSLNVSDGELRNCFLVWCSIAFLLKRFGQGSFSPLEEALVIKARISSL